MVSAQLKTTLIRMVREQLTDLPETGSGSQINPLPYPAPVQRTLEETAKQLGYTVTSMGEYAYRHQNDAPAWKDALGEIWKNEEEDSIILFCYTPYTSIPYGLVFIEDYTDFRTNPDWTGSEEWKKKMDKEWKGDISTDKKRIKGLTIGMDRTGYEETSRPIREDVTWNGFISWAGMNAMGDDFKTSLKGAWIFRKPIMIPEPYNLTLPPAMVKNLREAMRELKPTL